MTATAAKKLSPLERIRNRPTAQDHYTFALDPNDAPKIAEAHQAVRDAEIDADARPKSTQAREALKAARKTLKRLLDECVTCTLTLQSIGPAACEELQHQHPATEEQLAAMPEGTDTSAAINIATYAPALISASLVSFVISDDPDNIVTEMSVDDATAMWAGLQEMDQIAILGMARIINGRSSQVDTAGKG